MDCTGHITSGHKEDAEFIADIFFDPMNDLDPDKKLVGLNMFDGDSVYRKAQNILRPTSFLSGSRSFIGSKKISAINSASSL